MTRIAEDRIVPHTPRQVFDLVVDVEAYPQFLPWCTKAHVYDRTPGSFLADLDIGFKSLSQSFTTRVNMTPPEEEMAAGHVEMKAEKGPFKHLDGQWELTPADGKGTRVAFSLDFEFRSFFLRKTLSPFFSEATRKLVSSFEERADTLYAD